MFAILVLEVEVNQMSSSPIHIENIVVLNMRYLVLFQLSEGLHRVEATCEIVKYDPQTLH